MEAGDGVLSGVPSCQVRDIPAPATPRTERVATLCVFVPMLRCAHFVFYWKYR